jgi:MFS family permease
MQTSLPFTKMDLPLKVALGNIIMITNIVVWYICTSAILRDVVNKISFIYGEKLILDIILFSAVVVSMLAGAYLVNELGSRKRFLFAWNLMGVLSSLALIMLETATVVSVSFLLILVGVSFGLGLPSCMAIFAGITKEENRAQFGSIVILSMFFGIFALGFMMPTNLFLGALVLAVWRVTGLTGILLLRNILEDKEQKKSPSLVSLLNNRWVLLYLIPWTVFSMVNYLGWPINSKIHGEDFFSFSVLVNNIIAGIFALVAGFVADNIGRKRTLVGGFIIFGIGYALLGIDPFNIYAWYFYTLVDGIAWGIFYVVFWFTIWGDLAHGKSSEKYYAVGIIPYSLSGFLRVTLGPYIANAVSEYAIFSFAAFFLFLAVVPLMYAPETLPEKAIRERELRGYIEKAKRVREKFTKG